MRYFHYFLTKSMKLDVYFIPRVHLNLDLSHSKYSIAICG